MPRRKSSPAPGQIARVARVARGWTQAELAATVGVKQSTISGFERGDAAQLGRGNVVILAAVLGLDARLLDPSLEGIYAKVGGEQGRCPTCGRPL